IDFCMTDPELNRTFGTTPFIECEEPSESALFVDGSMFDRNPLSLAYNISKGGISLTDGKYHFNDEPDVTSGRLPKNSYFWYIDALNKSYPNYKAEEEYHPVEALFPTFGSYSQGFVRSAQSKEIYMLIDQHPEVKKRIFLTQRDYPAASGLLANFFGFFDQKLRIFDFYLGMYDAHRYFKNNVLKRIYKIARQSSQTGKINVHYPELTIEAFREKSWRPYRCLQGVMNQSDHINAVQCQGDELRNFRILLQISMNRLYDGCSVLNYDQSIENIQCKMAMSGKKPSIIQNVYSGDFDSQWQRRGSETEFQYTMRLLQIYGFEYTDLKLDRDEGWLAMSRIREILAGALDEYAKKLPPAESIVIRVIGKPALNFFKYQPPQTIVYLGFGTVVAFGLSFAGKYSPSRWIRFNLGLQVKGLTELLSPRDNAFTFAPLLGLEFENTRWSNPALQLRLGLRAGYQFSTEDSFLAGQCNIKLMQTDTRVCSAPLAQTFLAFTLFERVRIEGGVEWFPYFMSHMNDNNKNIFNGFIDVGWQWISPF
ncbi:MAG: hypothetical protein JXR91_09060, partial [Deltaproteobacteria bacterium]|nr:hypothetical protein [Deltaproteobacteria bacterium]